MTPANEDAIGYLDKLAGDAFFGTVTLKFERGQIVHVRKEENLRPSDLSGTPRNNHGTKN